jgi:putative sterol carrier protein
MPNENVLAHVFLDAVFTNFELLAQDDPESAAMIAGKNVSILFVAGIGGPKATITISDSQIKVTPGKVGNPDIVMFFPIKKWMTNMLSKKGFGIPLPLIAPWKLHKAPGLLTFIKLGDRLDAILQGPNPPKKLKAKLLLNTIAKTIAAICNNEPESKATADTLHGVAELSVKNGYAVNILFTGSSVIGRNGKADEADLIMGFDNDDIFLNLADDKVDVMAAICLGDMVIAGDLHMGDVVNTYLDKVGVYLQ